MTEAGERVTHALREEPQAHDANDGSETCRPDPAGLGSRQRPHGGLRVERVGLLGHRHVFVTNPGTFIGADHTWRAGAFQRRRSAARRPATVPGDR